jgi:ribose transport system ATP-binding protein
LAGGGAEIYLYRSANLQTGNVLEALKISKRYPGVLALDEVEFDLKFGEVQALVGQNGAGKSTFIEIIAGSIQPDSGQILLDGRQLTHLDPALSIELGIQTVHQENQLVEELSVAENIYLYNLPTNRLGFASLSSCIQAADALLQELGIDIDSSRRLIELTFVEKKLISIAKAFSRRANILILDEPTASLDKTGKTILFDIIKKYTRQGLSVIYISHHLSEIFEICDRVTIFKDGRKISTLPVKDTDMTTIVRRMIGKAKTTIVKRTTEAVDSPATELLEVVDYHQKGVVDHVSFEVKKGEIFGLGGLVGSGRSELARLIFGLQKKDAGQLIYSGQDITAVDPSDAIRKGIGYLTENRKLDGLITMRPIFENISVVELSKSRGTFLNLSAEKNQTGAMSRQLAVKTPTLSQAVINLSGGNQQKVVVAKWLYAEAQILIFDEPTVGIDVGSKSDIYKLMIDLARQGKIIIMISSDNPELVTVCDRVGIMRFGRLVTILAADQISEENILKFSLGVVEKD